MTWILLFYVLPFLLSCGIGYYVTKGTGETRGQFLLGVLTMLVPLLNIAFLMYLIAESLSESKIIKSIKEYLKQPL